MTRPGNTASVSIQLMTRVEPGSTKQTVHLLPAGTFHGRDGRGPYSLKDPAAVMAASRARAGRVPMPIDYDHQIDFAGHNGKPAPAAGWIKALHARADGIWGLVEWTERAASHLDQREYRYLSPVFTHALDGTVTGLLRAALTNNPNLDQLTALASMETNMDDLAPLRELLGLPNDADIAAIIAKVRELLTARQAAADPSKFVPIGDFERAVSEVNRLNQGISLHAATNHVEAQIVGGKLPPFLKEWGISLCSVNKPEFDKFMERTAGKLYAQLFGPSHVSAQPPGARQAGGLSDEETAIASNLGVAPDAYLKTKTARGAAQES